FNLSPMIITITFALHDALPISSGVCLEFAKDELVQSICQKPGIKCGSMKYPRIKELRTAHRETAELPFVKRYPFQDEREFRIIRSEEHTSELQSLAYIVCRLLL